MVEGIKWKYKINITIPNIYFGIPLSCELCGNPLLGKGKKIMISGAILNVCDNCVKYGTPIYIQPKKKFNNITKSKDILQKLPKKLGKDAEYEIIDDYSKIIKNAREGMGWTIDLLAQQVHERVSIIKKIESGKMVPSIDLAKRLERVLGVKLLVPPIKDTGLSSSSTKIDMDITLGDVAEIRFKNKRNEKSIS
ncbi:MAG: multiprotein bridging factor aMBF1 [Candidatus Methanomethylicia archaeon]